MPLELDPKILLATIVEGIGQPFYIVDRDWRFLMFNEAAARHFGRPVADVLGRRLWDVFAGDRDTERGRILLEAMASRRTTTGEAVSRVNGHIVSYSMFPVGEGLGVILYDVSEHRRAEADRDAAEAALRKRTAELETILETVPTAVWYTNDRAARHIVANPRAQELLRTQGRFAPTLSAPEGERPSYRFFRDDVEVATDMLPMQRAARGEDVPYETLEVRFADGESRLLLLRAAALRDGDGNAQGAVCAAADVTERHRYEDHLKLLVNELNHRVKNTLAIVQSIAALTLKDTDPTVRADFEQRLLALSGVHDLLTDANWDGARLMAVARTSLQAHLGGQSSNNLCERISFSGEDFRIRPKSAVAVSIALHELGTNAAKYGALSSARGSVAVRWTLGGGRFRLTWEEIGGPPVHPPTRKGFGSRMIERALAAELQGTARIDYRPTGVVCSIDAPLETIQEGPPES
jgi:PAS domain S-box-containing protein